MSIETMKLALEALTFDGFTPQDVTHREVAAKAVETLRTAIQQAEARTDNPVAYVCPTSHHAHDGSMEDGPDYLEWADEASGYEKRVGTPLYTHPAPGVPEDVMRDAERYRWLRDRDHWPAPFASSQDPEPVRGVDLDAAIDAAMLAAHAQKGGE